MKPGSLPSGHRRLPASLVVRLEGQGCGALGCGSLEGGVCDSLSHASASVSDSHHPGFVLSPVCQGEEEEIQALRRKGAVEPAPPTPGFFSCMFVVAKATGGWRSIIDLSTLNLNVDRTPFRMETSQTVLRAIRRND